MNFDIKPLTPADQPFLWEKLYQAIYIPEGQPPYDRNILHIPELRIYAEHWGKPDDIGFIALADEKPAGAVWLRMLTGEPRGFGYVDDTTPELSIALLPEYRGKGFGSQLMTHLFECVKSRYGAICLSVSMNNPAMRLYQRMGFEVVSESDDSYTMVKRLDKER
ncbi:MAG: GNAT family N-acetyltransferase [Anaerolineales bacterium]|nr:GNAT family N-acetyltransferase [Anaerolineales bacterium]